MYSPESSTPVNQSTALPRPSTFSSTVQPSQTPSSTPHPTYTATIFPPTQTVTPDAQAALTQQAREAYVTRIASYPAICDQFRRTHLLSPNGTWLAISCGNSHDQTLEVVRRDGTRWILQFRDYVHPEFMDGEMTPVGGLEPVQWTADEKYLFFSSRINFSGGGFCCYRGGDHGLFRLNLTTGAVSVILPVLGHPQGYLYAFSPGARRLAYVAHPPMVWSWLMLLAGQLQMVRI